MVYTARICDSKMTYSNAISKVEGASMRIQRVRDNFITSLPYVTGSDSCQSLARVIEVTGEEWIEYVEPVVEPTVEEIFSGAKEDQTQAIQDYLDQTAQQRRYDGILSLCTYVTSTDPIFAAEGQAGVEFRDACWRKGYEVMGLVISGDMALPTTDELLSMMPVIGWPT
jgi:hypothetical protein